MSSQSNDAAKQRGAARSAQVESKVRGAMDTIQKEMQKNGGIYPNNGGAVSMNEVARIAQINQTTLFSPKQRALGLTVKAWVETLKEKEVVGRMRVRRTIHERADDWRRKFLDLQHNFVSTELELQDLRAVLEEAQEELDKLRTENAALLRQLSQTDKSRVTPIKKRDV